jgi:predicted TIM-barrel fold metal-dependent hydrolase
MDATGVDRAVVIAGHEYLRPDGIADTRRVNDGIAAYRDRLPGRFPAAVGIVEPLHGPRGHEELRRIRDELGLVGVSIHARFQGTPTNGPLTKAVVEVMAPLGLVPFVHAVAEHTDEALWRVEDLARSFPDVTFLVLDCFSSFEQSQQVLAVAERTGNLVFDTSLLYTFDLVLPLVRSVGAGRVVFGTDLYSRPLGYRRTHVLDQILASDLSDDDKRLIVSANACRLLGIDEAPAS